MDFKDYIFKDLSWPLCLTPGPVAAVCLGLARVFNGVVKNIYWLRDQFNPATCDDEFLPMLAESRGITRHRLETDDVKFRQRVVKAFAWQLLGGKNSGMPKLLKHFGYEVSDILNVRSDDPNRWAEFKINIAPLAHEFCIADYELLIWAINESKPARSKLAAVVFKSVLKKKIYTGGKVITGDIHNIPHRFEIKVNLIQTYAGAGLTQADTINIGIRESEITISPVALNMGIVMQQVDITSIPAREV